MTDTEKIRSCRWVDVKAGASYCATVVRACLAALVLCAAGCRPSVPEADRPNFVLIMADDMGYSDLGATGGEIRTPNLDALAERGLLFTRFYNDARCSPTRASLLTGLYPHEAGMGALATPVDAPIQEGPYQGFLSERSATIAELLRAAGYRTYMSGKWHLGERPQHWPTHHGFDRYFGLISGASSYFEIIRDQPRLRQMANDADPWDPPQEGFYMTDAISDSAVAFVRRHAERESDRPFFLYVAHTAPHWPLHALPEDVARYEGRYEDGWDVLREERYERMREMDLIDERHVLEPRPETIPAWEDVDDKPVWVRRMQVYAAMMDRMDQGIARLVEALDDAGVLENTVIFYLSDNGASPEDVTGRGLHDETIPIGERGSYDAYREPWANVSNVPFRRYKRWTHEGGIISPLIVHWPAGVREPERRIDAVAHVTDVVPTLLELAGAAYPEVLTPLAGRSLLPLLRAESAAPRHAVFWEHEGHRAVRDGAWKLVYDPAVGTWELYDMDTDPTEMHDLSTERPDLVADLEARWETWAEKVGARR